MHLLTLNCGSSSLKYGLYETAGSTVTKLSGGTRRGLGPGGREDSADTYAQAVRQIADDMSAGGAQSTAVAHRIVHGGRRTGPAIITPQVLAELDGFTKLAPLHNGPALQAVRAALDCFEAPVRHIAVFDTAFHQTLPDHAAYYALPFALTERYGIRRFGFHGLAHRSMLERFAAATGRPPDAVTAVTLQLGSGCSAAAIRHGRSIDTSMGFTPLEGLMMGTRSGDIDPALVSFLANAEGLTPGQVEALLNTDSGLRGVSGLSSDVAELLAAEAAGHQPAALALNLFCYRAARYLASYLGLLGTAAVIFGGGIGENAPAIRARICAHLAPAGLAIDAARNRGIAGGEGRISADDSRWPCHVVGVDEEQLLAQEAATLLSQTVSAEHR